MLRKILNNQLLSILILLIFHFVFRFLLLENNSFPFNSDEAVVGLMAKHILKGENFLYFYGQSYMGSVDAYLIALGFSLFGEEIWVIRLTQVFLYAILIIVNYLFVLTSFNNKKIAFYSSLFMVFPTVNTVLYTTVTLGGYVESLLLGILSFYISTIIIKKINNGNCQLMCLVGAQGFILGAGLFINPLSLTLVLPSIINAVFHILSARSDKSIIIRLIGIFFLFFFIGSSFFWYALLFSKGASVLQELSGSAVAVENQTYFNEALSHLVSFLLFGLTVILGIRPPWSVELFAVWIIPFVLSFWLLVFYYFTKQKITLRIELSIILSLTGVFLLVIGGFIFTSFGVDPSGRYFLPLMIPLSVFAGYAIEKFNKFFLSFLAIIVLAYQIYGTWSSSIREPFITTQFYSPAQVDHSNIEKLKEFLINENEFFGFSNYWIAYPLAFVSDEEIIAIPKLPYHTDLRYTERDNRISKYNEVIKNGAKYFYITSNNKALDEILIKHFFKFGIKYKIKIIDDYHVYYDLSKKISPEELGLVNEFN